MLSLPFPIETVRGTHYEMGLQNGRAHRHVIVANVHSYAIRHSFQGRDEDVDAALALVRAGDEAFAPWVFDELRGIAEGSGVPYPLIVRMHLRVWNRVPVAELPAHAPSAAEGDSACTGMGLISDEDGVVVGGTLDDPRQSNVLIRRIPRDGIPHIQMTWAGAGWGHNGVNAAGLSLAQSSVGACVPPLPDDTSQHRLRGSLAGRILLETCEDVPQALATLARLQSHDSYVLGDARGNVVAFQSVGGVGQATQRAADHEGFVFNTNHVHMPDLVQAVVKRGSIPKLTEYSVTRFAVLERARVSMPRAIATIQQLLRTHDGYPNSICNDGTVMATYALPEKQPGVLYVADAPPCRNEFHAYAVQADA